MLVAFFFKHDFKLNMIMIMSISSAESSMIHISTIYIFSSKNPNNSLINLHSDLDKEIESWQQTLILDQIT